MSDSSWDTFQYRVRSAELVTPVIRELWLEPVDQPMPFRAGQYLLLADTRWTIPQRSYSVANAPRADGELSILVTLVPDGPTSTWAHGLSIDDDVSVEGPFGTFVVDPGSARPVLLLGAGSGLAPLRSLAEALLGTSGRPEDGARSVRGRENRSVTLFFSGRTARDAIDRELFESWERDIPEFDYRVTLTREAREKRHTRIPELLIDEFETLRDYSVFTSGPPGFVTGCQNAAEALGAARAHIRTEEFFTEPAPWTDEMPNVPGAAATRED